MGIWCRDVLTFVSACYDVREHRLNNSERRQRTVDLEKVTAHALTHLLTHHDVHVNDLHASIKDAHNLRDEEMPMVHAHVSHLIMGFRNQGMLVQNQMASLITLNPEGREEALQFLESHGYPPPG